MRSLAPLDLIDEYRLQTYPVVIGSGTRLFGPDDEPKPLTLVDAEPLGSGVVILTYATSPPQQ